MEIFISILLVVGGLAMLVKGADVFVDGSSQIAKRFNISERVIGLTLVAFGTNFPELSVSVVAAINKSDGLVIGNIIGSNIFNIAGVLGIIALVRPIQVSKSMVKKDIPMNILSSVVLFILLFDMILSGDPVNRLTRSDALILLLFFCIFLYYTFYSQITGTSKLGHEFHAVDTVVKAVPMEIKGYSLSKNIILIVLGLGAVLLGGYLTVEGGVKMAEIFGMSHAMIGLTIVAIGTSLPEVVIGIIAVLKGKDDIAIGNVLGSGVFNAFFILGASALISPITMPMNMLMDVILLIIVSVFLLFSARSKGQISKGEGVIFLMVYIAYLTYVIHRG